MVFGWCFFVGVCIGGREKNMVGKGLNLGRIACFTRFGRRILGKEEGRGRN